MRICNPRLCPQTLTRWHSCNDLVGVAKGGAGDYSGLIQVTGNLGNLAIAGDEIGGAGGLSGAINSGADSTTGSMGKITIGRNQLGGDGSESALIYADGPGSNIASVTIGGEARTGSGNFAGGVIAGGELGPVAVKGSSVGQPEAQYFVRGGGPLSGSKSLAIASLTVGGDLDRAVVLAGFGPANVPVNGHPQIGVVDAAGGTDQRGAGGESLIQNSSDTDTAVASIGSASASSLNRSAPRRSTA